MERCVLSPGTEVIVLWVGSGGMSVDVACLGKRTQVVQPVVELLCSETQQSLSVNLLRGPPETVGLRR
jgi:hypothetical protein